jgi:CheY-like chemotaxis protein
MNTIDSTAPIDLLLVEDDPGDVLMTKEALEGSKLVHSLHTVSNGEEALAYLRHDPPFEREPRPDLILLDLNLPRLDGHEVLSVVKSDADLRRIPIVVLSTSEAEEDILRSYDLHANAYVTKPVGFDSFMSVIRQVDDFFLSVVRLPPR